MKKRVLFEAVTCSAIIILCTYFGHLLLPSYSQSDLDFSEYFEKARGQLLSFYGSEIVSHTALILGFLVAAATLVSKLQDFLNGSRSSIGRKIFFPSLGLVVGMIFYSLGRLIYWSALGANLIYARPENVTTLLKVDIVHSNATSLVPILNSYAVKRFELETEIQYEFAQFFGPILGGAFLILATTAIVVFGAWIIMRQSGRVSNETTTGNLGNNGRQRTGQQLERKRYFIMDLLSPLSNVLRQISLAAILRYLILKLRSQRTLTDEQKHHTRAKITEVYVLLVALLTVIFWSIIFLRDAQYIELDLFGLDWPINPIIIWMSFRIFEIMAFDVDTLLFEAYREGKRVVRDAGRYLVLILVNYGELVFLFAVIYRFFSGFFDTTQVKGNLTFHFFQFSFSAMTSFSSTSIVAISDWARFLELAQSSIGLFMILIALTFATSILKKPEILTDPERIS